MNDELSAKDILAVVHRQKLFILLTTLAFVVAVGIVLLLWPKTYESESIVQLAALGSLVSNNKVVDNLVFSGVAAKALMESSVVLQPAVILFSQEVGDNISLQDFKKKHLTVEIYKQIIGRDEEETNYLTVTVKAPTSTLALEVNALILLHFLNYTRPFYNRSLQVYKDDYTRTNELIQSVQEAIDITEKQIHDLEINKGIGSASDTLLLTKTLADYRSQLLSLYDRKTKIEVVLADQRRFKVVSEPEAPEHYSSPPTGVILLVSLVVGFLGSLAASFVREEL